MGSASERLRRHKERVLTRWMARLRDEVSAAGGERDLILVDTLPAILDQLGEALSSAYARRTGPEGSTLASEHGGERRRITHFRLEDLITEYRILRQVLVAVLTEEAPLTHEESETLHLSLDQMIAEACTGYALVQASLREQLFAIVAHDLRSPLGAAHAGASLILRMPTSPQVPRWAARIVDNVERLDRMVQDLLDAIRVQTGARLELDLAPCDVTEIARATVEHLELEYGDRFVLDAPAPIRGLVAAEPLRRALENLATNAIKYGAPDLPITVSVRATHGRAIVSVHNRGAHIPVEQQETLFRAFERATKADAGRPRGWGLGLAQVRAVAEAHGGSIGVDSQPDTGTTFIIDIPLDARPFQRT